MLAGIGRTAPLVDRFIDAELARCGLDDGKLALVGFSQGTMMSLHVGPRRKRPVAAILGFSGALVAAPAAEAAGRPPVMLIHGDADDVIPIEAMFAAVSGLQAAEVPVQWVLRPGLPHSIDPEGIAIGGRFLREMLPR
jgi:phospholipase/carboxylesterase